MDKNLEFGAVLREPDIRLAEDMSKVIIDKDWLEENENAELYYMYRDLWKNDDRHKILSAGLRYDITVIPPRDMGREFVKTKGHYHPEAYSGLSYPEIYEVLEGEAHYLLQKKSSEGLEDAVLIKAKEGEKALIPPNYGHITINPSKEVLKMANWVNRSFDSIYKDILERKGGAYYELTSGEFIKNNNYKEIPELREADPTEIPELGIETGKDMYGLIENLEKLDFLSRPYENKSVFEGIL